MSLIYQELLLSQMWKNKRETIIERDKRSCKKCHNKQLITGLSIAIITEDFNLRMRLNRNIRVGNTIPNNSFEAFLFTSNLLEVLTLPALIYYQKNSQNKNWIQAIRGLNELEVQNYISYPKTNLSNFLALPVEKDIDINSYTEKIHAISKAPFCEVLLRDSDYISLNWVDVKGLNVHHTYYQEGLMPWEYPENSLTTYCHICHMELHATQKIPCKDKYGNDIGDVTPCFRCGGAGEFPEFKHVEAGICFRCRGAKYEEFISF